MAGLANAGSDFQAAISGCSGVRFASVPRAGAPEPFPSGAEVVWPEDPSVLSVPTQSGNFGWCQVFPTDTKMPAGLIGQVDLFRRRPKHLTTENNPSDHDFYTFWKLNSDVIGLMLFF